jgi:hypothetical protein
VWLGTVIDHVKSVVCMVCVSVFVTTCNILYFVSNFLEWIKFSTILFIQQYHFIKHRSSYLVCFAVSNTVFTLPLAVMFQSVSHLKVLLHIIVGGLIGVFYIDSGNDGSKTVSNLSYLFICIVYLSYTTMLPAVLRCKF